MLPTVTGSVAEAKALRGGDGGIVARRIVDGDGGAEGYIWLGAVLECCCCCMLSQG